MCVYVCIVCHLAFSKFNIYFNRKQIYDADVNKINNCGTNFKIMFSQLKM